MVVMAALIHGYIDAFDSSQEKWLCILSVCSCILHRKRYQGLQNDKQRAILLSCCGEETF